MKKQVLSKKMVRRFVLINIGLIITALALHLFLVPANLAVGGVTGLGMIVKAYIPSINLGVLMLCFNALLFLIGFLLVGKEFTGYTIYASFALSGMIALFEAVLPVKNFFPDDLLMNLIYGIILQGVGLAIVFYQNASTGGTDIIAKVLNKYTSLDMGKALFASDAIIAIGAGITFNAQLGMYAFLGILANGLIIDKVIAGFDTKVHVYIISTKNKPISQFILQELDRGATYLQGQGMYSYERKDVISVVLPRREYIQLKKFVAEVDPKAFIIMNYIHDVAGEGFTYQVRKGM